MKKSLIWVLLAAIFASSMAFIDGSALNVALPAVQADLKMTGVEVLWVVNGYSLFLAALILVGGAFGDRWGRKLVFMIGIALFTASSCLCGLSSSGVILIASRALQGIGAALMVPGSLALLSASYPSEKRGGAIGLWSTFSTLTTFIGPLLGGWLAGQGLWRAVFFINVPLGVAALFVLAFLVEEKKGETTPGKLDVLGAVLGTLGLAGLTFGFTQAPDSGWADPFVWGSLAAGALALVGFAVREARFPNPMMPLELFRNPGFAGTNLLTLFLYAALGAVPFFFVLNLVQVQGYGPAVAALTLLPFGIILVLLSSFVGRWTDRFGAKPFLIAGPLLACAGFCLYAVPGLTGGEADFWGNYFPAILTLGLGMGLTVAPLTSTVMGSAPQERSGAASGINNAVARTGGVLALAIFGAVMLSLFGSSLSRRVAGLDLPESLRTDLMIQAKNLGNAQVPSSLTPGLASQVRDSIRWAFVDAFRVVALCGAGLAFLSALMSWSFLKAKVKKI